MTNSIFMTTNLCKTTSHDLASVLQWLCLASAIKKSKHVFLLVYFFSEVKGSVSSCRRWLSVWWVSTGWCLIDQWLLHLGRCRHFRSHSHAYNLPRGDISILAYNCLFQLHVSNVYKSSRAKAQMTTPHCNHSHLHAVHPLHASQLPAAKIHPPYVIIIPAHFASLSAVDEA